VKAIDLMPGQYVRFKHHWNDLDGSPTIGQGARALVISVPFPLQSEKEALILTDDGRLHTVIDWWLRLHCEVL